MYDQNPDGSVGPNRTPSFVGKAINQGSKERNYSKIRVPILAFFAVSRPVVGHRSDFYGFQAKNEEERLAFEKIYAADRVYIDSWEKNMRDGVPEVRIVELPGANHYIFFTNETDVLHELHTFVASLK